MEERISEALYKGKNIFITGQAGVGKSYTIHEIITDLQERGKNVMVTASTGIAALNIGGVTGHKFFGSGIANSIFELPNIISTFYFKAAARAMCEMDVVIIDEISMVSSDLFVLWDRLAQVARRDDRPFGGLQVIMSGDFLQLPPVITNKVMSKEDWVFNSTSWSDLDLEVITLHKIHRQDEQDFIHHLSRIRLGFPTDETHTFLKALQDKDLDENNVTKLVATNNEARAINMKKLDEIESKVKESHVVLSGDKKKAQNLLKDVPCEEVFSYKLGAQVLVTVNDMDNKVVNGTRGTITRINSGSIDIETTDGKKATISPYRWKVTTLLGKEIAAVVQYPLKLAWAITQHKSQGMTMDGVHVDCKNIFAPGQLYVGLSRSKNLKNLKVVNYTPDKIKVDLDAREFYRLK